jgi:tetratricopeptide (TPR) repeat protein
MADGSSSDEACRFAGSSSQVIVPTELGSRLRAVLLLALLFLAPALAVQTQKTNPPADSPLLRQVQQAVTLDEHGDRQGAMDLVSHLLEQRPNFEPAIKLKGLLLEESGRSSEAAAAYEQALKLAPDDADVLLKTGAYKLNAGQTEQAIQLLQHCLRILPSDGDAEFYLAQAYHANGQNDLALHAIRQSLKAEPDNLDVWQKYGELLCITENCDEGLRWLLKAQKSNPKLPRIDYDIAVTSLKLMDLNGAAEHAARAVDSQPNDVSALQLLASVDVKVAKWQEARQAFERILVFKPNDIDSLFGLGQCELELKNYPAAVEKLQLVLRLAPTRLLAHYYLSRAFAAMGRTEDAKHEAALHQLMMEQMTFVRSVESEGSESVITAPASQLLAEHHEEDALLLYRKHFKGTAATLADAYVFIGKLYLILGNKDAGLRCLHHALEIQPTVRGAHTYEGILALKLDDLTGAETEFKAELANDPNYQTAIAELGEVRYHQQRWAEAAEQLAKSRTMTPELLYMLCDSYFHIGKVSDADLTAETAAAYGRNNSVLMKALIDLLKLNGQTDLAQRLSADLPPTQD